jgi:DNA ligase-1
MITRPMKGEELEIDNDEMLDALKYPLLATPKFDGIRSVKQGGKALSSSFKDIPNRHVQKLMASLPEGLDGELIIATSDAFNDVQSGIMSEDGEPDFQYMVFDYVSKSLTQEYQHRIIALSQLKLPLFCVKVLPTMLRNRAELIAYEAKCLAEHYEGIMIRSPDGPYKCGKATVKQGWLLKVKRFKDSECVVIGFEEQQENTNEKTVNELGKSKRSTHKAGMILKDTLGKFLVREVGETPWKGREFAIGTGVGLTQELRQEIWDDRDAYLGKIITYKFQAHGVKDLPRLPIYKGFRDPRDMS